MADDNRPSKQMTAIRKTANINLQAIEPLASAKSVAVSKSTAILPAPDLETTNELAVVVREEDLTHTSMSRAVIPHTEATEHREVTIVPHNTTGRLPAVSSIHRRRPLPKSIALTMWMLGIVVIGSAAFTATGMAASLAPQPFVAEGARLGAGASGQIALGPWSSSAGSQNALGIGGGAGPGVKAPGSAGLASIKAHIVVPPPASAPPSTQILPAPFQPWPPSNPFMAVPGHSSFAMNDPNGYYYQSFGQCTWWAQYTRRDENLANMGNAMYWAAGAAARGYHVGAYPVTGATVVFQPGVEGAGGAGHVAHVEAVYPDGWFLISEMNFYWNGGGWARVDYRYAHMGAGVAFIY